MTKLKMAAEKKTAAVEKQKLERAYARGSSHPPKPTQSKAGHAKHMKAMGFK